MAPKRQKVVSVIWDYFSVNAQNEIKAKCNQCNVSVPRGGPGIQKTSAALSLEVAQANNTGQ